MGETCAMNGVRKYIPAFDRTTGTEVDGTVHRHA